MISLNLQNRCLATALLVLGSATVTFSTAGTAAPYSVAPVTEYMQLPKFCWGHFNDDLRGEEFYIPRCGVGTNHYCDGLLSLQRAKKARDVGQKKGLLAAAKRDTLYTKGWIEREGFVGTCFITSHVQQTLQEIELLHQIYHIK